MPVTPTAGPSASTSPSPTSSASAQAVDQAAIDRLMAAGRTGDRSAWDSGVTTADPSFASRTDMLYANLRTLRLSRLRAVLTGAWQRPPAARRSVLGPDARVVQVRLAWRLPADEADAVSSLWFTLVPGPAGPLLAGTDDGASIDAPALPLWWLGPVTARTDGDVTVLAGRGQDLGRWADLAVSARRGAADHLPRNLREDWDGHLVVEVPSNDADLAAVLGVSRTAYATTAAVTRPEGPTTAAALRVVVNPATASESDDELETTLTHETVHVATRSAKSHAPLWAVEGLAEYVALEAHPKQRDEELGPLRSVLRDDGVPDRLPRDRAFAAGSDRVGAAYAEAWLVCKAIAAQRSRADLGHFYAALDDGDSVSDAARAELGVDDSVVRGWWRASLDRVADGRTP